MTTYYTRSGFAIVITRPVLTSFTGTVDKDGSDYLSFGILDTNLSLNAAGEYTFTFSGATVSDPTSFRINNYDTGEEIATLTFPLTAPLILVAGIDGESDKNLTITYPLQTFTFANPGTQVEWVCTRVILGQSSNWEETITGLPDPKIIGNLTGCTGDSYVGNASLEKSCSSENPGNIFLFAISDRISGDLLYSRIECCCPTVTPAGLPDFVCTCPDFSRATSYNQTLFSSSISLQSWINSGAGAKGDCKHIMAAKRIMNIEQPVYSDPPYSAPPGPSTPM